MVTQIKIGLAVFSAILMAAISVGVLPIAEVAPSGRFCGNDTVAKTIRILELRNYVLKPGQRETFTKLFEDHFITPQEEAGSYVLGQYRVKGAENNFFWIRGFSDMVSRKKALTDFYYGKVWKQYRGEANPMLVNNDNVYLLTPLDMHVQSNPVGNPFSADWFRGPYGIAVVDFYISNTKRDKLISFMKSAYMGLLSKSGVSKTSFWVSEETANDFPALPVFQDKNLLVQITFYKDEPAYQKTMKDVSNSLTDEQKSELADLVTISHSLIITPTEKTRHQ